MTTATADRTLFDGALRDHDGQSGRRDAYLAVPTVQAHATMLETLPDGDLGCVWFGGTQEGVGDVSIWFARLAPGATRWSDPVPLSDDPARSEQNPVLFNAPTGELWLLYTAQLAGNQDTAEVRRRISSDGGVTWGPVSTLFPATEAGGIFIRQPVTVTRTGRWLVPIFRCVREGDANWVGDHDTSSVMISDDAGQTWREVPVPGSLGCVHMCINQLPDGSLHALFRSRWADHVYACRSSDDGDTWTAPTPTELPNNNSSINSTVLADGRLALIYNHSSRLDATQRRVSLYDEIDDDGVADQEEVPAEFFRDDADQRVAFWGAPRAPMTLAFSADGGRSWEIAGNLDEGDGYCLTNNSRDGLNREFSYPAIHQAADGSLDIAYTYFRQTIKHVHLPATWTQS